MPFGLAKLDEALCTFHAAQCAERVAYARVAAALELDNTALARQLYDEWCRAAAATMEAWDAFRALRRDLDQRVRAALQAGEAPRGWLN